MLINDLPIKLREMALKEIEDQRNRGLIKDSRSGRKLIDTFFWHQSEKGYDFWKAVNDSAERSEKRKRPFFGMHGNLSNVSPREVVV